MSEEWKTFAQQIADLKRQRDEALRMLDETHALLRASIANTEAARKERDMFSQQWARADVALVRLHAELAEITHQRDQYKLMCELHDAQLQAALIKIAPRDTK